MPNVSGNPNLPRGERTPGRFFNTAVFSAPPQDVKGNAGVGILRGPGINNWDISFGKTFEARERLKFEFRAELFNAFNHSQWASIDTWSCPAFLPHVSSILPGLAFSPRREEMAPPEARRLSEPPSPPTWRAASKTDPEGHPVR